MAENANGEEKTEKATSKKRKDARKKGQVLKSQDVSMVCSLFLTFFVLRLTAPTIFIRVTGFLRQILTSAGSGLGDMETFDKISYVRNLLKNCIVIFFTSSGFLLLTAMAVSVLSTGIQTKFLVTFSNLKFKLSKLNPLRGIKGMFSKKKLFEVAKSLLKMIILVAIVYSQISKRFTEILRLVWVQPSNGLVYIAKSVFSIAMVIGLVFVAVAVADYFFQKHSYEENLKMTKQEVKDEFKQMEGDPKIKAKRRGIQMRMAYERMMKAVPTADVIIRNPTHYAVAVKYDPDNASAPVVLAKGKDRVALRIVDVAEEAGVPAVENKPLARALYDKTEIGREIAPEFYQGVADVLWFVYNLKNKPVPTAKKLRQTADSPYNY